MGDKSANALYIRSPITKNFKTTASLEGYRWINILSNHKKARGRICAAVISLTEAENPFKNQLYVCHVMERGRIFWKKQWVIDSYDPLKEGS